MKFYSVGEVAKLLGKAEVTVRMLVRTHHIGQKVGRDWILSEQDIETIKGLPGPGKPKKQKQDDIKPPD